MKRRRTRRQPDGGSASGWTEADYKAARAYRANRGSKAYYRDLNAIDDKPLPATAPADKNEK